MKMLSLLATAILALGFTLGAADAEAKRLGSGKSAGMQRQMSTPPAKAPTAAPAPAGAAAAAPQAQPKRSWMGPIAGLAAGLGLAALASHFGFGEELASMMMIGLVIMAVVVVIGFVMRRRAAAQSSAMGAPGGLQYATARTDHQTPAARPYDLSLPASTGTAGAMGVTAGATAAAVGASSGNIPADFDVAGFVRNAKVHFIRLQAANDAGNVDDIREFTTPEMFAEIRIAIGERGSATQETDVIAIDADVLDVNEEAARYVASVRFTGQIREDRNGPVETVDEIWHLVKPREGQGGWLLAGIQQIQ